MSLAYSNNQILLLERKMEYFTSSTAVSPHQISTTIRVQSVDLSKRGKIARIKEMFKKVELSVSSYDTAWVAMVPSKDQQPKPCFPECLDWVMKNQCPDGSWCLDSTHPLLVKDSLSSTLACVLALQKWKVGDLLVKKGLDYIGSNSWAANDKHQYSPIGFDIVFPGMIDYAKDLGLNLPLNPTSMDVMHHKRDLEVERGSKSHFEGKRSHLIAYVAEGLGKSYDWKEAMMHQRTNGSLFNSPSTTAAALINLHDDKCFHYLHSLLKIYKCAVPTVYPLDLYTRLRMVDSLQSLGIEQYFKNEIESVLEETYRQWMNRDEELVLDITCYSMAFRLLRMNGYEISSDALAQFDEEHSLTNSVNTHFTNTNTILELYRASEITISLEDTILDKLHAWTRPFLKQQLLGQDILVSSMILKREIEQGKLINGLSLCAIESHGKITEEEARTKVRGIIESNRRQLLKIVLQREGSLVPKACKDLFWKTTKILHYFYRTRDEYTSPRQVFEDMNAVVHDHLQYPS